MMDSKERFSDRVDNYVKFRPSYPGEAINCLIDKTGVVTASTIADIGSGTGKFTQLLVSRGLQVYAVEPNKNMRHAAEKDMCDYSGFNSVNGSAEETTLPDHGIDLITVAQAFHWFNREKCGAEFKRILKPGGKVALIWNRRDKGGSEFMLEYEHTIKHIHGGEVPNFAHDTITDSVFGEFFASHESYYFHWAQHFDFDGLWGRAQSSSYSPPAGHPNHEPLKTALKELFDKYQRNSIVDFAYRTELIIGEM